MPFSTDITLPKTHKARFPDKCVVCGRPSPGSTVTLATGSIGWWTWLLWHFGSVFRVTAPACRSCGRRLHLDRFLSLAVTIAGCVVACWVAGPYVTEHFPHAARKWIMMGMVLATLCPYFLYQTRNPDAFCITAHADTVDYEFRDREMAYEFALLNAEALEEKA